MARRQCDRSSNSSFLIGVPTTYPERLARDYLVSLVVGVLIQQWRGIIAGSLRWRRQSRSIPDGLYLLHMPILWFCFRYISAPILVQSCLFAVLCVVTPWAAYRWIEQPMIDFGRALASRSRSDGDGPMLTSSTAFGEHPSSVNLRRTLPMQIVNSSSHVPSTNSGQSC